MSRVFVLTGTPPFHSISRSGKIFPWFNSGINLLSFWQLSREAHFWFEAKMAVKMGQGCSLEFQASSLSDESPWICREAEVPAKAIGTGVAIRSKD
jgi:hypothetical protein